MSRESEFPPTFIVEDGCVNILTLNCVQASRDSDIALRWSAGAAPAFFYRHIAPLEQKGILRGERFFLTGVAGAVRETVEQKGILRDKRFFTPAA